MPQITQGKPLVLVVGETGSTNQDEVRRLKQRLFDLEKENRQLKSLLEGAPAQCNGGVEQPLIAVEDSNVLLEQYMQTTIWENLRGRLPWLVGLLLLQSAAALVMRGFEELLEEELIIAFFVPMIIGTGGNAGNQPGVAVTRALGLGRADRATIRSIIARETLIGLITSTVLTAIAFGRVVVEYHSDSDDFLAAGAISIAVFLMVNLAIFLGVVFSIVMDAYSIDPANGSAPLLTTVADLIGITLLCGISYAFFNWGE